MRGTVGWFRSIGEALGLAHRGEARNEKLARVRAQVIEAWKAGQAISPDGDPQAQGEAYTLASLYHSCVGERATAVGQAELEVHRRGAAVDAMRDPYAQVFLRPNGKLTRRSLLRRVESDLWTYGEFCAEKRRSNGGVWRETWPLRADWIDPVPNSNGELTHYRYGAAREQTIDVEDVIHLRRWNPLNCYRGLPPAVTLYLENSLDRQARLFLDEIFRNQGVPSAYLSLIEDVDDKTADRYQRRFAEKYGRRYDTQGGTGRGKLAVFGHSAKLERFGIDPANMDLGNVFRVTESRICSVMQVPALLVGAAVGGDQGNAYGHLRETRWAWWWEHVIPEIEWVVEELSLHLAAEFGDEYSLEMNLSEVPALQGARSQATKDAVLAFRSNAIDRNECRRAMGLKAKDTGSVWARDLGVSPGTDSAGDSKAMGELAGLGIAA